MNKILTLVWIVITVNVFAQKAFVYKNDFKIILAKTKDSSDNLSYNKLLNRFTTNDSTLTDFEVLALLIGFTDQPEYKPYQDLDTEREIYDFNGQRKYKEALNLAGQFLKSHPVSVKALIEKSYSFYKLEVKDSAQYYLYRGQRIINAMHFSGKGETEESPDFCSWTC